MQGALSLGACKYTCRHSHIIYMGQVSHINTWPLSPPDLLQQCHSPEVPSRKTSHVSEKLHNTSNHMQCCVREDNKKLSSRRSAIKPMKQIFLCICSLGKSFVVTALLQLNMLDKEHLRCAWMHQQSWTILFRQTSYSWKQGQSTRFGRLEGIHQPEHFHYAISAGKKKWG